MIDTRRPCPARSLVIFSRLGRSSSLTTLIWGKLSTRRRMDGADIHTPVEWGKSCSTTGTSPIIFPRPACAAAPSSVADADDHRLAARARDEPGCDVERFLRRQPRSLAADAEHDEPVCPVLQVE